MAGLADAIVGRFSGKSPAPDEPDEDDNPESAYKPSDSDDDDKPGAEGKILIAAIKRGDGEAVEECVRRITGS